MAVKLGQEVKCPGGLEVSLQKRFDIKLQGVDILGEHILDEGSPVLLRFGNFGAEKAVYAQPYGVTELSGQGGKILLQGLQRQAQLIELGKNLPQVSDAPIDCGTVQDPSLIRSQQIKKDLLHAVSP